jgi:hypothetical protein
MDDLSGTDREEFAMRHVISPSQAVDFLPAVVLDAVGIRTLCNGGSVSGDNILEWDDLKAGGALRVMDDSGVLRAIGASSGQDSEGRPSSVSPVRVLLD